MGTRYRTLVIEHKGGASFSKLKWGESKGIT